MEVKGERRQKNAILQFISTEAAMRPICNFNGSCAGILPNSSRENGAVFQLRQVTYENVLKQLKALRNDTSTGPDGIPVRYIKLVQDSLSSPLTHIINAFIESNNFPSSWKCARIVPINKVPTPVEKSDFRPIAILPALSKIFERLVCSQVIEFIENTQLYKDTVTGFRKGYSTGSALLKLRDDIRTAMKSGELSIIVLIEFSKAFDTISHETLIKTLHKCDFSKDFLRWTLSYLTDRKQFVQIDDKTSKKMTNLFGVPQGSILGPLFFNLYVNGLQDKLPSKTIQYADDTTVYTSCKPTKLHDAERNLNSSLESLAKWANDHSLAINAVKSKHMICASKHLYHRNKLKEKSVSLLLGNDNLVLDENPRLLGVHLDKNLDWTSHLQKLLSSCYGKIAVLRKLKNFTTSKLRKQLIESLIFSKIDFNDYVYSPLTNVQLNSLQRLQKVAASFVLGRYCSRDDIVKLNWLPIKERREFNHLKLTHKAIYSDNWPDINKLEIKTTGRALRNSDEIKLQTSLINGTFQDEASKYFNQLPTEIRNADNLSAFCSALRKHLFARINEQ